MLRARWAAVIFAGTLSVVSGCASSGCWNPLSHFGIGNNRENGCYAPQCDCACNSTYAGRMDTGAMVGPETVIPFSGVPMSSVPMPMPSYGQPKVVPIPQAPAVPYIPGQ